MTINFGGMANYVDGPTVQYVLAAVERAAVVGLGCGWVLGVLWRAVKAYWP